MTLQEPGDSGYKNDYKHDPSTSTLISASVDAKGGMVQSE